MSEDPLEEHAPDRSKPRSQGSRTRAALAAARAVVAAWDKLKDTLPPGLTQAQGKAEVERRRLAVAEAISKLRDELMKAP